MADLVARSEEWADPDQDTVDQLTSDSARVGWRTALGTLESRYPFFARRMCDFGLANWHLLLLRSRQNRAMDIGCGFGSLALGLADYYESVTGIDALRGRVSYAAMRAAQDRRPARFAVASAHRLPVGRASVDFVTMNGVLEWAALFEPGNGRSPRELQLQMLREAHRVLAPGGTLAVAIENRFAMETLVGMPDTHTGMRLLPALPRGVASAVSRFRRGEPFLTYLYDRVGYRRLGRQAGFSQVRVIDLVSSYNDYDFMVDPADTATYRLLWWRGAVRSFQPRAAAARRALSRLLPGALPVFAYAYLLLMGERVTTLLDAGHGFWTEAVRHGFEVGTHRFAVKGTRVGTLVLVTHDGRAVQSVIELGLGDSAGDVPDVPAHVLEALDVRGQAPVVWSTDGITARGFRPS